MQRGGEEQSQKIELQVEPKQIKSLGGKSTGQNVRGAKVDEEKDSDDEEGDRKKQQQYRKKAEQLVKEKEKQRIRDNKPMPKTPQIIVYVVLSILSVAYMVIFQLLSYASNKYEEQILFWVCSVLLVLCLWSYYLSIATDPKANRMKGMPQRVDQIYKYDQLYQWKAKYCKKCKRFKLPRMSHCSKCASCIYKLDHHCYWTQNCVSVKNYKAFCQFCLYMCLGCFIYCYLSVNALIKLWESCLFFSFFSWYVYIFWFVTSCTVAGGIYFTGTLFLAHSAMYINNFSTLDSIKKQKGFQLPFCQFREYFLNDEMNNVFDRGQIQNIKRFLGGSTILHFLVPSRNVVDNDFVVDEMAPYPSQYQFQKYMNDQVESNITKSSKLGRRLKNCEKKYAGQRMLIKGKVIKI